MTPVPLNAPPPPACHATIDEVRAHSQDTELLARLVFAEGVSTGCASPEVFEAIAWGVTNRARLAEHGESFARRFGKGIRGVIFKPGQFNPAVSPRSRFSKAFRCPAGSPVPGSWSDALSAALIAREGEASKNPFLKGELTEWERKNKLSLVAQFYYPRSEQATPRPPKWADVKSRTFVRDVRVGGKKVECVWFFRVGEP